MNHDFSGSWEMITHVFNSAQKSAMHCTIATIDSDGVPHIVPIGTLFLTDEGRGFFFDTYADSIQNHTAKYVCITAIDTSKVYWLSSMIRGRFGRNPGVRLYCTIGKKREPMPNEIDLLNKRLRPLRWTRGSQLIWSDFNDVRDFQVEGFKFISYPNMA